MSERLDEGEFRPTKAQILALGCGAVFLLANMIVPILRGDIYPFTSAPMFRDAPVVYCNYHVYAPDGAELPQKDFLLHRLYDGNPVGYGVGVRPPDILERFGEPRMEAEIRRHILPLLELPAYRQLPYVELVQETIGAVDENQLGVVKRERFRISREAQP